MKGKENEGTENSKTNESTDSQGKESKRTESTTEVEEGEEESVNIEIDDRLSDDLENIDFIDRDGEDETKGTS